MNILENIHSVAETATVLSTGQKPELKKDLLVVGKVTRDEFQTLLLNTLKGVSEAVVSDDAVTFQQNGNKVGVAYYDEPSFSALVNNIAQGYAVDPIVKHWSVGPWLPEIFASDMVRSRVLTDNESYASRVADVFKQYPDGLRKAIIKRSLSEIAAKSCMLDASWHGLSSKFLAMDICLASMRLLYATENVYFRGFKYESMTQESLSDEARVISLRLMMYASSEDSLLAINHYLSSNQSSH